VTRRDETIENPETGERVIFRRRAADTKGELLEYELLFRPRGFVATEHVHPRQEERHEVIRGSLGLAAAGREQILGPGDVVVVPPGTPHRLWAVDDEPAQVLFQLRPALRAEELIETFVRLARAGKVSRRGYPGPLQLAVLADEFADEGYVTRPPRAVQRALVATLAPLGRLLGYRPYYRDTD
jgi:quercetin dioxygenase-like cupin family protein